MSFIKEFQEFAIKGNVMDMAVGVIIGGAFGKIVTSLVNDVIMPPIGMLVGKGFGDLKLELKAAVPAQLDAAGTEIAPAVEAVTLNYGAFIQTTVDFLIIAFVIFLAIKGVNSFRKQEEPAPEAPAEDPADIALLKEIRDELRKRQA